VKRPTDINALSGHDPGEDEVSERRKSAIGCGLGALSFIAFVVALWVYVIHR